MQNVTLEHSALVCSSEINKFINIFVNVVSGE